MLTYLFVMLMFGAVAMPLTERCVPPLVDLAARYVPQVPVATRYAALTHVQRRAGAAALATLVAYPLVQVADALLAFLFVPFAWTVLLFTALLTLPVTHDGAASLLRQYVPGGTLVVALLPAYSPPPPPPHDESLLAHDDAAADDDDDDDVPHLQRVGSGGSGSPAAASPKAHPLVATADGDESTSGADARKKTE